MAIHYSAHIALAGAPHGETPGLQVSALVERERGWQDIGVVSAAEFTWSRWDEAAADEALASLGWRRVEAWDERGCNHWARVVRDR